MEAFMHRLATRLDRLEPPERERPIKYLWNEGQQNIEAEEAALMAQGFDVVRIRWRGRTDDARY